MYNVLIDGTPTDYKGYSLNTDYRVALRIQQILEDPRINKDSEIERMAAYMVAISLLFVDEHVTDNNKLGLYDSIQALFWWLSCGKNDRVENYWKRTGIMPDMDSNTFDKVDYENGPDDLIDIESITPDGKTVLKKATKYSILAFDAPDGTTRYVRKANGDKDLFSLYEDSELIYSGFYKIYNIDLASEQLHWFKFSYLLAELLTTEGTSIHSKIGIRSFNPADYKGKNYADYRNKMLKAQSENKILGILPYVDGGS